MRNILLFGGPAILSKNIATYLGNTTKSQSALVYFEFPNKKFQHPTIIKNFSKKNTFYLLQSTLLNTVLTPKREFENANFLIWILDWNNLTSLEEGFRYFKKIVESRKSFLPLLLIGYRSKNDRESDNYLNFLKIFRFQKELSALIQIPVKYIEIEESKSESFLLIQLKKFFSKISKDFGEHYKIKHFSTIALEEIFKEIQNLIETIYSTEQNYSELIPDLMLFEKELERPVTGQFLQDSFGCNSHIAKKIIDLWNFRPEYNEISSDALLHLKKEANEMIRACEQSNLPINLVELVNLGYNPEVVQYVLKYLFDSGKIATISHHIESEEFREFRNIREIIVIHEGRTLYLKTTNKTTDQTLMFSNMIQAIEMIRNDYIFQAENKKINHLNQIEFLEFGELKALIGNGNKGIKVILRLIQRPSNEDNLKRRLKNFLKSYENQINLSTTTDSEVQKKIRQSSEKIFYRYFNPFPINVDVYRILHRNEVSIKKNLELSDIESSILKALDINGPLMLEDLISQVSEMYQETISRSDILQYVLDLFF